MLLAPTAKQTLVDGQEMPVKVVLFVGVGLGTVWEDQVAPVQRSAIGAITPPMRVCPTAIQDVVVLHEMESKGEFDPGKVGNASMLHVEPFQRSIRGATLPGVATWPAARHSVGEGHTIE